MSTTTCEARRRVAWSAALLAVLLSAAQAHGQGPGAPGVAPKGEGDQAAARVLFAEGRRLMKEGRYEQACPKLQAASKLYPGSGVRLNLADCFARTGRLASAWAEFANAASLASETDRSDDLVEAKRRQAELEPRLSRLTVRVQKDVPGLVVKRDGSVLDRGAWGTPLPVDPGTIAVDAEAPGYTRWSQSVRVSDPGVTVVDVPPLSPAQRAARPAVPATPAPPEGREAPHASYWTLRRVLGVSVTGAGLVGLGVGGVLGLLAKSRYDKAAGETGAARHDDSASAVGAGNVASVVFGVGAGVAAAGIVLWLTAPSASTTVGTSGTELLVRGTF